MKREKISVYLDKQQIEDLKALSSITRVKMADYIREGIDMVFEKYKREIKKAKNQK